MRIKHLKLQNFRGFADKDIAFPERFSVIIGDNGTGKTAVLEALALAIGSGLNSAGVASPILHLGDLRMIFAGGTDQQIQLPSGMAVRFIFSDGHEQNWSYALKQYTDLKHLGSMVVENGELLAKQIFGNSTEKLPVVAYFGTGRLWAEHSEPIEESVTGDRIQMGYRDALSPVSSIINFRVWFRDMLYNANTLRTPEEMTLVQLLKDAITEMVPDWQSVDYDFARRDIVGIRQTESGPELMPFSLLSDGYRNMIGMVADIAYRCIRLNPHLGAEAIKEAEGVILIDEIDLHLHPNWQRSVVGDLKRIFPKLQFVATTHSPFIVQSLENAELIDLNGKEMSSPYLEKSIEEIAAGEMGVENVQRSQKWLEWRQTAERYFDLLNSGVNILEQTELRAELDRLEEEFAHDPAYVALLKTERRMKEAQQ